MNEKKPETIKRDAYFKQYRETHRNQINANAKTNYEVHKDEICEYKKAYYETHKDELTAYQKVYRETYPDRVSSAKKAYYETHKDKIREHKKAYYETHADQIRERERVYNEANKDSIAARNQEYVKLHRVENRDRRLKNKYNISLEMYELQFVAQDGKCLICNSPSDLLFVDHDHKKGNVRGLLCKHCSFILGHARDDISILQKAILYLRSYTKEEENEAGS